MAELGPRVPTMPPERPEVALRSRHGAGIRAALLVGGGSESLVNALRSLGTPIFGSESRGPGASCLGSSVLPVAVKVLGRVLKKTNDRREK